MLPHSEEYCRRGHWPTNTPSVLLQVVFKTEYPSAHKYECVLLSSTSQVVAKYSGGTLFISAVETGSLFCKTIVTAQSVEVRSLQKAEEEELLELRLPVLVVEDDTRMDIGLDSKLSLWSYCRDCTDSNVTLGTAAAL